MKQKLMTAMVLLVAVFVCGPTVFANTHYVNGLTGNDSNSCGSATTACKTIGHAITLSASGDSIIVAPATYTENLTISISLTVIGSRATTTIIDGRRIGNVVTISSTSAHVILSNLTIRNGYAYIYSAYHEGGGVINTGTLTITRSIISGNVSAGFCLMPQVFICSGGAGGGIGNIGGALTLNDDVISGNTVSGHCVLSCAANGGGIWSYGGSLTVNNSTISGNVAAVHCGVPSNCSGVGGIFATRSVMMVSSSTISGNGSDGIVNSGGTATLQNSIVAANGANCRGTMTSHGYNLSSDGSCNFNHAGDLNNHDPLLGPLQNNGGPTDTMALLPGSPAIDGGNPSGCTDGHGNLLKTDQRGMPRPDTEDKSGCDMGAYERQTD